jgi:hypothetical protein
MNGERCGDRFCGMCGCSFEASLDSIQDMINNSGYSAA